MAGDQGGARRHNLPSGKPIVGFLYSVSRTAVGEYWPVHIGQNVIGSSSECDIVLNEGTVSQRHAILHINKMKKPEKVEATISDCQSTNGTMVNGNSVSVARPPECVNGDIITIGENYELLFILIDVKAIGLTQSEEFIALEEKGEDMYTTGMSMSVFADERSTRNEQDFPPRFSGPESPYSGQNRPIDGTVGMDPGSNSFSGGGTVGM
jgi:pSer/pThr/pTyr-binding forkhead associated (FHA) protein